MVHWAEPDRTAHAELFERILAEKYPHPRRWGIRSCLGSSADWAEQYSSTRDKRLLIDAHRTGACRYQKREIDLKN